MRKVDAVICGGSLSSLVLAEELGKSDLNLVLINPSNHWGGHFSGIVLNGIKYDLGMVLHEFTSYIHNPLNIEDIQTFNPSLRNDSGRFCNTLKNYVLGYQDCHEISDLQVYIDGKYHEDILLSNSLENIKMLPFAEKMRSQIEQIMKSSGTQKYHASNKLKTEEYQNFSFDLISKYNHGQIFHREIIDTFCKKIFNCSTERILALFHRVPWLPLFYPETLYSYLSTNQHILPRAKFSYPTKGCVSDLIETIKKSVLSKKSVINKRNSVVNIEINKNDFFNVHLDSGEIILTKKLAWSDSPSKLLDLFVDNDDKAMERASFTMIFVKVSSKYIINKFSVLSIIDPSYSIYRVTNQSFCNKENLLFSRLVIELNSDYFTKIYCQPIDVGDLVIKELIKLKIVEVFSDIEILKVLNLKNILPLPTMENLMLFNRQIEQVREKLPLIELIGSASGFCASSMNNQILHGLKIAEKWMR